MRILDLHIDGFGKFHDLSVSFDKDLNVVYGKNEAGKSTLHTFIRCMLFGLERGRGRAARADLYSKYEPWQNKAVYGGRMRVEKDGVIYRLERNFQKDQKAFVIVNETAGKEIEPTKGFMDFLLGGLTETAYNNTISIGQLKCVTEGGMVTELRNYIANMNTTGNLSLNITKATSYLKNRRKEFERQLTPEAARTYTALLTEIKNIEKEISAPEYENQLQTYQDLRSQVKNQLSEKQTERETLLQKIAKGRQALDGAQFTDEASIHAYQENARNTYAHYKEVADAASRRGRSVLPVIMLVLAVFCALGAGALGFLSSQTFDPVVFGTGALISVSTGVAHYTVGLICALSAAAVFFFAVGLIFFMKNHSLKAIPLSFEPVEPGRCSPVLYSSSIRDMIDYSLRSCVERNITVRRCKNCGRWFPQTGRVSAEYCERPVPKGQQRCRDIGALKQWTLRQANNDAFKAYRKEYKRRFAWIKAGRITDQEFYDWSERARAEKDKCEQGLISQKELEVWLKESK